MGKSLINSEQNNLNLIFLASYCIIYALLNMISLATLLVNPELGWHVATIANNIVILGEELGFIYILTILN